jgi:hypothetical protein
MDEHRHYSNGVVDEMYQLQFVVEEETSKEIPSRDVDATLEERCEDDLLHIFGRELLPTAAFHSTPSLASAARGQLETES